MSLLPFSSGYPSSWGGGWLQSAAHELVSTFDLFGRASGVPAWAAAPGTTYRSLPIGAAQALPGAEQVRLGLEREVVARVNRVRAGYGLRPLALDSRLTSAATRHSAAMAAADRLVHSQFAGPGLGRRLQGFGATRLAENVAQGASSAQEAVDMWMSSPTHRRNLLDPNVDRIGVARVATPGGVPYWTQLFAG